MSSLREVQTISQSPHILPMPSLTRLTTGGVLNPLKNTTNTSHNELLHLDPLQPPLEPRILHTRSCLLPPRQQHRILDLFASDCHVALEATWSVYQNIIDAYRDPNKIRGKALMQTEIDHLSDTGVPGPLTEIITLGRTLKRRPRDILAYFDHPHTTGDPTEAINAPPRTPTRIRTRTGETSPTTTPAASSKQEDSNHNYTLNYEEPFSSMFGNLYKICPVASGIRCSRR